MGNGDLLSVTEVPYDLLGLLNDSLGRLVAHLMNAIRDLPGGEAFSSRYR